jgi:hypothetical protein
MACHRHAFARPSGDWICLQQLTQVQSEQSAYQKGTGLNAGFNMGRRLMLCNAVPSMLLFYHRTTLNPVLAFGNIRLVQ